MKQIVQRCDKARPIWHEVEQRNPPVHAVTTVAAPIAKAKDKARNEKARLFSRRPMATPAAFAANANGSQTIAETSDDRGTPAVKASRIKPTHADATA